MKKFPTFMILLLVLTTKVSYSQTPVPTTFKNLDTAGTPTRIEFSINADEVIMADQSAGLLIKVNTCTKVRTPVTGLNSSTDFCLDRVKKISPIATVTALGSFRSGSDDYPFANLNADGTIATIDTRYKFTGSNQRMYHAIELTNGNILVTLDKNPTLAQPWPASVYSINNVICGQVAELTPAGGVIPRPDLVTGGAYTSSGGTVPAVPNITDLSYLPSGDIFFSGSFINYGTAPTPTGKALKLSANGMIITPLFLGTSSVSNQYSSGIATYLGVTYVAYTSGTATSPTITIFDEATNTFSATGAGTYYINVQSSPRVKNGRIFVTGSNPVNVSTGSTIAALDVATKIWYDYDDGLWTGGYSPNQTVTHMIWGESCNCAVGFGNMGTNAGTLASNITYQFQMCLVGPPLASGVWLIGNNVNNIVKIAYKNAEAGSQLERSFNGISFYSVKTISEGNGTLEDNPGTAHSFVYYRIKSGSSYSSIISIRMIGDSKIVFDYSTGTVTFPAAGMLVITNMMGQRIGVLTGGKGTVRKDGQMKVLSLYGLETEAKKILF